jgi:hypothetical protein
MNTKYAIIGHQGVVIAVSDTQPTRIRETDSVVVISQELAAAVENRKNSEPKGFYFYDDGEFFTQEEKKEKARIATAKAKVEQAQLEARIRKGERHIEKEGFTSARLVTCMDTLLQAKESGTLESRPKLAAVYGWLQAVKQLALTSTSKFPQRPFSFEEVLAEQLNNSAL